MRSNKPKISFKCLLAPSNQHVSVEFRTLFYTVLELQVCILYNFAENMTVGDLDDDMEQKNA